MTPSLVDLLEIVDEAASTSEALKARALAGGGEAALLAQRQTAGRGRLGRSWVSDAGNLHLSVLLRPGALRFPGHWSILSGVALFDAVRPLVPGETRLRLKWPNDLLLDGAKVAGILVEASAAPEPWLVIGFGVNVAFAPTGLGRAVTRLAEVGPPPTPERVAGEVLRSLGVWRARYAVEGFAAVRAGWMEAGHRLEEVLTAGVGAGRVAGAFRGLGDDGSLLLDGPLGPCSVVAGEVA